MRRFTMESDSFTCTKTLVLSILISFCLLGCCFWFAMPQIRNHRIDFLILNESIHKGCTFASTKLIKVTYESYKDARHMHKIWFNAHLDKNCTMAKILFEGGYPNEFNNKKVYENLQKLQLAIFVFKKEEFVAPSSIVSILSGTTNIYPEQLNELMKSPLEFKSFLSYFNPNCSYLHYLYSRKHDFESSKTFFDLITQKITKTCIILNETHEIQLDEMKNTTGVIFIPKNIKTYDLSRDNVNNSILSSEHKREISNSLAVGMHLKNTLEKRFQILSDCHEELARGFQGCVEKNITIVCLDYLNVPFSKLFHTLRLNYQYLVKHNVHRMYLHYSLKKYSFPVFLENCNGNFQEDFNVHCTWTNPSIINLKEKDLYEDKRDEFVAPMCY